MKHDVIIVGAGLEGSVIYRALPPNLSVVLIDDSRPFAGSFAAGCLFKPSWLSGFKKDEQAALEKTLNDLFGVKVLQFNTGILGKKVEVKRVALRAVLQPATHHETVLSVKPGKVVCEHHTFEAANIVVAAGVWCHELLPSLGPMKSLMGASLRFQGNIDPQLRIYAPYRQALAFNLDRHEIWFGDGTAILEKNWSDKYVQRTVERAKRLFNLENPVEIRVGRRPYIGSARGLLDRIKPGLWVATGGAKNGVALAALHAHTLQQELK